MTNDTARHARIGKITMKNGGAEVRVLHQVTPNAGGTANYRGVIVEYARNIADMSELGAELVGFVTIGLFSDGKTSLGCRLDPKASPIPKALLPAYVAEILRRDLITSDEAEDVACDVVNRSNGWDV